MRVSNTNKFIDVVRKKKVIRPAGDVFVVSKDRFEQIEKSNPGLLIDLGDEGLEDEELAEETPPSKTETKKDES